MASEIGIENIQHAGDWVAFIEGNDHAPPQFFVQDSGKFTLIQARNKQAALEILWCLARYAL